jgi:DNA-directed RNA polymerase specialized sigma24 family protein
MATSENRHMSKDMLSRMIIRAIQDLPVQDRDIFILKHYQNCSDKEIARKLSLPLPQVQESLQRSSIALLCSLHPLRKQMH